MVDSKIIRKKSMGSLHLLGLSEEVGVLKELINAPFRPIIVTGPTGVGKTAFVEEFVTLHLPPNIGFRWLDLQLSPDPVGVVDEFILRLRHYRGKKRLVVVLDAVEGFTPQKLQTAFDKLFNYKIVQSIIAIRQNFDFKIRGSLLISLGPEQMLRHLYNLKDQFIDSHGKIIQLVAPQIISFNDTLIEHLRNVPEDLYNIPPRKFEEILADLLTDMGMEVELTPATRDGGKDILAYLDTDFGKLLCLVEAKRYKPKKLIGVELVRTLLGTLVDHQATMAMLVTTSRFSNDAKTLQERHKYQLSLKDYGDVVSWLSKYKNTDK